jgi:hypothetical protein
VREESEAKDASEVCEWSYVVMGKGLCVYKFLTNSCHSMVRPTFARIYACISFSRPSQLWLNVTLGSRQRPEAAQVRNQQNSRYFIFLQCFRTAIIGVEDPEERDEDRTLQRSVGVSRIEEFYELVALLLGRTSDLFDLTELAEEFQDLRLGYRAIHVEYHKRSLIQVWLRSVLFRDREVDVNSTLAQDESLYYTDGLYPTYLVQDR